MKTFRVYALLQPGGSLRDVSTVHYIGLTTNTLQQRLAIHIAQSKTRNSRVYQWLRGLNSKPGISLIEEVAMGDSPRDRELYWINHYTFLGAPVANREARRYGKIRYTNGEEPGLIVEILDESHNKYRIKILKKPPLTGEESYLEEKVHTVAKRIVVGLSE